MPRMRNIIGAATVVAFMALGLATEPAANDEAREVAARTAFRAAVPKLKPKRFIYLDPMATHGKQVAGAEGYHGWKISGEKPAAGSSAEKNLMRSMRSILDSRPRGVVACFIPQHGISVTDGTATYDVVMCFRCGRYAVYDADGTMAWEGSFTMNEPQQPIWDRAFTEAGLVLKYALP
jgi:hypothetical protein